MKIWAKVTGLQFRATHKYPEADSLHDDDAKTLQYSHSHRMYVSVKISQEHNNRDVEYITLENQLTKKILVELKHLSKKKQDMSCEDMATYIYHRLKNVAIYKERNIIVEVLEDNHNGAEIGD